MESSAQQLLADFDQYYQAIKTAEKELYRAKDRHLPTPEIQEKEQALHQAIEAFLDRMPRVFDPFAGGGAIPLEAARLGCRAYGNDINPVAHIIQRGSLEFPQRYGKPIVYSTGEFIRRYGETELENQRRAGRVFGAEVSIPNRLAFDVEYYAKKLLGMVEAEIGHYYPADENGKKPIAYYWARVGRCSNPACGLEIPLLKRFDLVNRPGKQIYLQPHLKDSYIDFTIESGPHDEEGWVQSRKNLRCPKCGNITSNRELKAQFLGHKTKLRLLAVIEDSGNGKSYRLPSRKEQSVVGQIPPVTNKPNEKLPVENTKQFDLCPWGFTEIGDMFSPRQLLTMQAFVDKLKVIKEDVEVLQNDYTKAVMSYLGIWLDRVAIANTSFGVWHTGGEKLERPMGRQAIAMVFDYPESNPFCDSTGSALNQLDWLTRYIESESDSFFSTDCKNASSGEKEQFPEKFLNAVVTDPPYYDAIAYADLSDFFYVWLKRTVGDLYPMAFAFPQTPKTEECTALKHHHNGDTGAAKEHFEQKLQEIFSAIEHQTDGVVSIMFAHQSTEAWTTLVNSILGAKMNITSSWANDTEMTGALKTDKAFLSSSVTVSCRPTAKLGYGDYKQVRKAIENRVKDEIQSLYAYGFRGADLLTACFGQAVSEFGQYKAVEKASGERVTVAELLEMAREAAFNAIVSDIETDDYTRFYIGWLQLFGFVEADHDTVRKVTQIGLNTDVGELTNNHLLLTKGNKQTLARYAERIAADKRLGLRKNSFTIDQVHRSLFLYKGANRGALLSYIGEVGASPESPFWRVLNSLAEILPTGIDDHKQVSGLLADKDSLIREAQATEQGGAEQMDLFG